MRRFILWLVDQTTKAVVYCFGGLRWMFEWPRRMRDMLADLRIIILLFALLVFAVVVVSPGRDVVSDLVDRSNATLGGSKGDDFAPVFVRWFFFVAACMWTGVNAWFWSSILYKTNAEGNAAGEADDAKQPAWFQWLRRVLGVSPLLIAMLAMYWTAPLSDNYIAMAAFAGAALLLFLFTGRRHTFARRIVARAYRRSALAQGRILEGDVWFGLATWLVSAAMFILLALPATRLSVTWTMGTAAITFFAIGAIIAVTSPLVWVARQASVPLITIGIVVALVGSAYNDNHAIRPMDGDIRRPELKQALAAWEAQPELSANAPLIIVTASGGASRAAYWAATVMRSMDERTNGAFSRHTFAISSVSGGTLGAVGYAAWIADNPLRANAAQDEREAQLIRSAHFTQTFFSADFLGPAIAGLLYPDLLQRFIPFRACAPRSDWCLPSRATFLEETWEKGWTIAKREVCGSVGCGGGELSKDFLDIWKGRIGGGRHWVPLVFANGAHVETGKRIITAPIRITPDVVEDAYDFFDLFERPIRASTAISNSARFPIVSPAGSILVSKPGTGNDACGQASDPGKARQAGALGNARATGSVTCSRGRIVDGGYFENGGVDTAYDLARAIRAAGVKRPIFVVEISNNDRVSVADVMRWEKGAPPRVVEVSHFPVGFLREATSILGGLYNAGSGREVMAAKRLSNIARSNGLIQSYFDFPLNPVCRKRDDANRCIDARHTTMSWLVTQQSRYAMDVRLNTRKQDLPRMINDVGYDVVNCQSKPETCDEFGLALVEFLGRAIDDSAPLRDEAIRLSSALSPASFFRDSLGAIQRLAPRN